MNEEQDNVEMPDGQAAHAELSDEARAELESAAADIRARLDEIEADRDAVLAGVDELNERFGDDVVRQAVGDVATGGLGARATALEAELAEAKAETLRRVADLENFRRRAAQNEQQARTRGQSEAVKSLLGVLDHFDLTLGHVDPEQSSAQQVLDGVQMIRAEMVRVLGTLGVEVINPQAGEAFDPNKHAAIVQQPTDEYEPGAVLNVARAGYAMDGQMIRPAEVVVAAEPAADSAHETPQPGPSENIDSQD